MTRSTMTVLFYLIMIIILIYTRLIYDLYYVLLDRDWSILFISNLKRLFLKFGLIGLFVLIIILINLSNW